jgi:hypothetical protein
MSPKSPSYLRYLLYIGVIAVAVGSSACGGGSTTSPVVQPTETSSPPIQTQSQPQTQPLAASSPIPLPAFTGFSGTITYSGTSIATGTTVTLQSFLGTPPNGPTPQSTRRAQSGSSAPPEAIVSFTEKFNNTATFSAFPIIHVTIPSSQVGEYTAEVFDVTSPLPVPYYENGIGTANGALGVTVTFSGGGSPFTVNAGDEYLIEVVYGSALGLPPPAPTDNTSTTVITGSAQTIAFPSIGGFSGQIQLPANPITFEQALLLNAWDGTPTSQVALDNTGTAGSNDFSIEATLASTESFPSGLFAFTLTFPASLQLDSSSVVTIFLCSEGTSCTPGQAIALSPATSPSLFSISGQTLTFSGFPSAFTMNSGQTLLAEVYIHY